MLTNVAHKSCGKVMFSSGSVSNSVHGEEGAWGWLWLGGHCGWICMAGGHAWLGAGGCAWLGCVAGGGMRGWRWVCLAGGAYVAGGGSLCVWSHAHAPSSVCLASGWFAYYWNADLFFILVLQVLLTEPKTKIDRLLLASWMVTPRDARPVN